MSPVPTVICPPCPVVLRVTDTRVRLASPVPSTPLDLSGFPLRTVFKPIISSLCRKKFRILRILSIFLCHFPDIIHLPACSAGTQSWSRAPNCSGYAGRLINNSSITFRSFINIAGNYHSSRSFTCIYIYIYSTTQSVTKFHNRRTPNSGFGLQVLPTSLIHTNNLSNITLVLL